MIISIAHQKGGVGKSTIAFNLAHYLSNFNPILIDLDLQNTVTYANKIRAQHATPFQVLTIATDQELKTILQKSNEKNLYIIDTGGFDSSLNRLSIMISNLVITPVSDKLFEILGLKKFESILAELTKIKKEPVIAKVLLNNISPATKKFDDLANFINSSKHFELMNSILRQRADVVHSSSKGLAIAEYDLKSKAHDEMEQLAKEIEALIYNKNIY